MTNTSFFICFPGRLQPHPVQGLQADPPADELVGRQLQDPDVCQPQPQRGVLWRVPQFTQVRQEGQPVPDRHGH